MTRDEFRDGVFGRDHGRCVLCAQDAVDAHHILERRLWPDGGYYLANGASLCSPCHLACERTTVTVERLREACGITKAVIPPHLYDDQIYDKWGNPVLPNGQRLRGDLFFDASVQKALREGGVLHLFTDRIKYPRTHHLPWSEGQQSDDRVIADLDGLSGREVVVTVKMDGENTTCYRDGLHARSIDSGGHPSRNWIKAFHAQFCGDIPEGWRVCGENLYAQHSIAYTALPSYFLGFSVWNDRNECLSWDETQTWFDLLGIESVPVLYRGPYDERRIRALWSERERDQCEGYVVRAASQFPYADFRRLVAKFVRRGHVQTSKHWMHGQPVVPNRMAGESRAMTARRRR